MGLFDSPSFEAVARGLATRAALDVVARRVFAASVGEYATEAEWGNYPEIGEGDWYEIQARVAELAAQQNPADEEYEKAYALLAKRAEGVEA